MKQIINCVFHHEETVNIGAGRGTRSQEKDEKKERKSLRQKHCLEKRKQDGTL
jgi:hypothetical protein